MKAQHRSLVVLLLTSALCSPAMSADPAGVQSSSDPSFDPQLFPKLAVIVVEGGTERAAVFVKKKGAERSTTIVWDKQTSLERAIEDEFVSALMKKGYTLSTRSDLLSVLKEQAIRDFALTEDNAGGIGKVLHVQAVMLVSATGVRDEKAERGTRRPEKPQVSVSISARLLGVENAKILWTGRGSQPITTTDVSSKAVVLAAKRIASALPNREATRSTTLPPLAVAPFDSAEAKRHQAAWARHLGTQVETTNSIGMKLVLIPAGEFLMGSPDSDSGAKPNEKPQHRVRITKPFYLGVYEVTQGQYQQVMGSNPSKLKESGETAPVENVSWGDVQGFCRKLSALAAEQAVGRQYRLPTEAEWEYACRAGSTTKYSFGDSESELANYAWYRANSGSKTHPVGQKQPNAWGLYDMHGNVFEWCEDWHGPYQAGPASDPTGPSLAGTVRVNRGGSWCNSADDCRSPRHSVGSPGSRDIILGVRVAASAPGE